jgi:UPF0271 protein
VKRIDLNCDLGEGCEHDRELMALITSANIACGGHAGDIETMRTSVELAKIHGVGIGAHPGYADREHFGRREVALAAQDLERLLVSQITALCVLGPVRHVKPHGALYNLAARDRAVADTIASTVQGIDRSLILFAPAGSELEKAGEAHGLRVAAEVFADRTYQADGTLTPRTQPNAVIQNEEEAAARAVHIAVEGMVNATDGSLKYLRADTICLHGDGDRAVEFARRVRGALTAAGVRIERVR